MAISILMRMAAGILGLLEVTDLAEATVVKAKWGDTAVLPCPSNDKLHRFQYWLLKNGEIIGPWNNHEGSKVRYEVWSGRLIIKKALEEESGFYRCFSKRILGSELKSETVEFLVLKDWEESFEDDPRVNIYRAVIAILVLLMVVMIGFFIFCKRRRRSFPFRRVSREGSRDSPDPSINNEVYRATSISLKKPSFATAKTERPLETAIVETDISTSFSLPN